MLGGICNKREKIKSTVPRIPNMNEISIVDEHLKETFIDRNDMPSFLGEGLVSFDHCQFCEESFRYAVLYSHTHHICHHWSLTRELDFGKRENIKAFHP